MLAVLARLTLLKAKNKIVFETLRCVVSLKYTDVSEVRIVSTIVLMIKTVRGSETSVYFNETTRRYIPEGHHLHTRRRENLKSHTKTN
jgi:hypothetical protein